MTRIVSGGALATAFGTILAAFVIALSSGAPVSAQNAAINDLRGKIFDAKMAQQTFAGGLKHCGELDGRHFYFQPHDRVLNLDDYHRSLESLAQGGGFNPATKRPWNQQDADTRWAEVQKQALQDQTNCALVASLPELQKKLQELEQQAAAALPTPPPSNNNRSSTP